MKNLLTLITAFLIITSAFAQKERNLLGNSYSFEKVKEFILPDKSWITYPEYQNRRAWEKIPLALRNKYIEKAEHFLKYEWPSVPATMYLELVRTGNRIDMEDRFNERRTAFETLVMAELMEGKGRFIDDIINGAFSYCEQTYWGYSAHLYMQKAGVGFPDAEEPTVDLGVGMMGTNLAWTLHFFKDEFDKVNPLISKRIKDEITRRVLIPYYNREDFWWTGFDGQQVNNWNPWCNYNILNCILLLEDDPVVRSKNIYKTMQSIDHFINYYQDDGGCDEGPSYWSHAGGKLYEYLELLSRATENNINLFGNELIKNMGRYIYRAYISEGVNFINFADASAKIQTSPGLIFSYGKHIEDPVMTGFGAFLAKKYKYGDQPIGGKIEMALNDIFLLDELRNTTPAEPLLQDTYLSGTQIVAVRDKAGSNDGFYFAAKGGHNAESHNHNDIGSCILYYNGLPVLIDVGVGIYSKKTFSSQRYEIWTMRSSFHNLPAINGIEQKDGKQFAARAARFNSTKTKASFSVEISGAYPPEAKVKEWTRSYTLQRGKKFTISDHYLLKENNGGNVLNYISGLNCRIVSPGIIELSGQGVTMLMKYDSSLLKPSIEIKPTEDKRLFSAWGDHVTRISMSLLKTGLSGNISVEFEKLK